MENYTKQVTDFLKKTGTNLEIVFLEYGKHFYDEDTKRNRYTYTLSKGNRTVSGVFGQSIDGSERGKSPTKYDILACMRNTSPGTFQEFCGKYGYDNNSIKATKVYEAVGKEYNDLCLIFNDDEMKDLAEIQ